ncbi:10133_t:CDS:2, partial [Rhizophagus irregularis]
RSEAHEAQSSKSSLNVITISEDEPESALYDDAPDDFSVSEQPQLKDKPFKLDCSAIIDNSTKIYEDSREIESSRSINKKRVLPTSSKNKRQRCQNNITDLLEVSESDGDGDNIEDSGESSKSKPEALKGMKNVFEVCQWLITERPDILVMANQMLNAMNTTLDSPLVNNMPTFPMAKPTAVIPTDEEKSLARLWHEKIKCLFLRCRAPTDEAIESLVKTIFNYDLYSNNAEEVICHSKRVLTDFRSKFNKKIGTKVREFKDIRIREGQTTMPVRSEIEEFMTSEVVEQILHRYLKGTNKAKLKKYDTMDRLVLFVREAFRVHYTKYDVKAIKELDNITMDCKVPSRSGKNIALKLSLE